ncbi:hypothetical protein BDN72DRAFT_862568 [Pluteus cervinus]|uniref:Uncharacterized protein n=1 Tax=Pluteus cervinus TaxID=181527 RepID=A0ACD3AB07_9AGAR|nr:hypothetical protein BDN72DRAFT_862568 [Pluteus cervinus]
MTYSSETETDSQYTPPARASRERTSPLVVPSTFEFEFESQVVPSTFEFESQVLLDAYPQTTTPTPKLSTPFQSPRPSISLKSPIPLPSTQYTPSALVSLRSTPNLVVPSTFEFESQVFPVFSRTPSVYSRTPTSTKQLGTPFESPCPTRHLSSTHDQSSPVAGSVELESPAHSNVALSRSRHLPSRNILAHIRSADRQVLLEARNAEYMRVEAELRAFRTKAIRLEVERERVQAPNVLAFIEFADHELLMKAENPYYMQLVHRVEGLQKQLAQLETEKETIRYAFDKLAGSLTCSREGHEKL